MKYTLCTPFPPSRTLKPDKPCAVSAGCSCSNHPRERTLARRPRNILSSPIQQQQQQQPLHIYKNRNRNRNRHRATLELCFIWCWWGGRGLAFPFAACFVSGFDFGFGSWLVARPTTFWLVCVRKCTWLDIFGWLFVSCCLRLHCDFHGAHANVENAPLWHWRYAPATMRQGH